MDRFENELASLRKLFRRGAYSPDFYRKKLGDISLLDNYESFCRIPFTYKRELRDCSVEERTTTPKKDIYGVFSSSGTTGQKTFYIYNRKDKEVHEEFVRAFYQEIGITEEDIGGIMAPVDTGVMAHTMMWQFTTMGAGYVNCPVPSPESMIDTVTKVPVTVIATRPSIASGVAYNPLLRDMARKSMVKKLLMGGGFLSEERRKLLEDSWNAKCYNMFGMSEMFGPMAGECRQRNGLHYLDRYLMIEIIDPDTKLPAAEGGIGVAVYTTLWDKGFPLLRYWTDDLMRVTCRPCPCGQPYPRLYFLGRLNDCFRVGGSYVFPENVENILFRYGHIGEYCVIRHSDGYLVKSESGGQALGTELQAELEALFDAPVYVEFVTPGSLNYDGHARRFVTEG